MQKNKLDLHICDIHLLNPYKTVVSHLKPITKRRNRNHVITFDSHLETALLSYTHQTDHKNNTRLLRDMEFSSRIQLAILLFVQFFLLYEDLTNMKKAS